MAAMTSRERVQRTVSFQPADRCRSILGAMKASGISVKAYNRVKAALGMRTPTRIWDPKFMIASVEEAFMRRFHLDVAAAGCLVRRYDVQTRQRLAARTLYEGAEGLLPPGTAVSARMPRGAGCCWMQQGDPTPFRMPREGYYFDDMSSTGPARRLIRRRSGR